MKSAIVKMKKKTNAKITTRWEMVSTRLYDREKTGGMIAGTDAIGLMELEKEIPKLQKVIKKRIRTQKSIIKKRKKAAKKEEKKKKRKHEAKKREEKQEAEKKEKEKKRQREAIEKKERERKKRRMRKIEVHYLSPTKRTNSTTTSKVSM